LELQIASLLVALQEGFTKEENHKLHLAQLEALEEKKDYEHNETWNAIKCTSILYWRSGPRCKEANHYPIQE